MTSISGNSYAARLKALSGEQTRRFGVPCLDTNSSPMHDFQLLKGGLTNDSSNGSTPPIEQWRGHLYDLYVTRRINLELLRELAICFDNEKRQPFLNKIPQKGWSQAGSDPVSAMGRGIFGDLDIKTHSQEVFEQFKAQAETDGFTWIEKPYYCVVPELNMLVWRPLDAPPKPSDSNYPAYLKESVSDPEIAYVGRTPPSERVEMVLGYLNKVSIYLDKLMPQQFRVGYNSKDALLRMQRYSNVPLKTYESWLQLFKATVKVAELTGVSCPEGEWSDYHKVTKMQAPPETIGLYFTGPQARSSQKRHLEAVKSVFRDAVEVSVSDMIYRINQMAKNASDEALVAEMQDYRETLVHITKRYQGLQKKYPHMMQEIVGNRMAHLLQYHILLGRLESTGDPLTKRKAATLEGVKSLLPAENSV